MSIKFLWLLDCTILMSELVLITVEANLSAFIYRTVSQAFLLNLQKKMPKTMLNITMHLTCTKET